MSNLNLIKPAYVQNIINKFCYTIGMIPTSYKLSLTYEEQILAIGKYLEETVYPAINNNAQAVAELQNLFIELKNYVDNYFDNLDVQKEIDNKLENMKNSGELANIINNEIFEELNQKINDLENTINISFISFPSMNDFINDTSIKNNMTVFVLGKNNPNDGLGAFYYTSSLQTDNSIPLQNNLYAILINDFQNNFYNEITYKNYRKDNTDYYLTTIPKYDSFGELINLEIQKDNVSPIIHAQNNLTSFTCNATLSIKENDNQFHDTLVISNGVIINELSEFTSSLPDYYQFICIDENRNFSSYQANTIVPQTLIDNGIKQAWLVWYKLIENSEFVAPNIEISNYPDDIRQVLGVKADGSVILFTNDGRTSNSFGFTAKQVADILIENQVINAWELDGGGSASTLVKTIKVNRNYDNKLTSDRLIYYTLNAKRTIRNINIAKIYAEISKQKQLLNYQLTNYITSLNNLQNIFISQQYINVDDDYVVFNTLSELFNKNANLLVNNNKLTCNKSGIYSLSGNIEITSSDGNKFIEIFVNGVQKHIIKFTGYNNFIVNIPIALSLNLNLNDEVEFKYYGSNGNIINRGNININYYGF